MSFLVVDSLQNSLEKAFALFFSSFKIKSLRKEYTTRMVNKRSSRTFFELYIKT